MMVYDETMTSVHSLSKNRMLLILVLIRGSFWNFWGIENHFGGDRKIEMLYFFGFNSSDFVTELFE